MSDFRPMNECKGFNMERVLLKNKNGYMITAYFKDGMLQCDGDEDWTQPIAWSGFIRLRDLANGASDEPQTDTCNIPHVSQRSKQLVAFAMWLRKSNSIGDAEILVNAFKEATNCG